MIYKFFNLLPVIFLFSLFDLIAKGNAYHYSYKRINECILQTEFGCVEWQSSLEFDKKEDPACFPADTYLQGRQNKIKISELKVGDEVLVYAQQGVKFQKILAWLHRDTEDHFSYNFITYQFNSNLIKHSKKSHSDGQNIIEQGLYISGMHNIAVLNNSTKIQYQYSQNLQEGDSLYGYGGYASSTSPIVVRIDKKYEKKGIYAPYTKSGNYFISNQKNSQQLILVHCFAHVSTKYHSAFDFMINLYSGWNIQPQDSPYIHPLSSVLKDLFPSVLQMKKLNEYKNSLSRKQKHDFVYKDSSWDEYRYESHSGERKSYDSVRKAMIIIDKIFSTVEVFV